MITTDGWQKYCIWEHSSTVKELYRKRCRQEEEEMTSHAQAADLLIDQISPGDTLLDVGCGSGYFYHSLKQRNLDLDYFGIDAAPSLIEIGQEEMPAFGLAAERLQCARIEDLEGQIDHVVCLNVLSNIDNFHRPLERLLQMARKSVILRESVTETASYSYVVDRYLDKEAGELRVHVNAYARSEFVPFVESCGFSVDEMVDRRTGGEPENVIDYPHYWKFFIALRKG